MVSQSELSFYGRGKPPPRDNGTPTVWSVSQLVRGANQTLEGRYSNLWVEGEVTGLKGSGGGHLFFSLVDAQATLPTAIWRSTAERLPFTVDNGQILRVYGRLGIFPKQGRMQFYADRAEPAGLGAQMLQLQQLKQRLSAEGLFDPARKRALPPWPTTIGVVTSAHGAAVHDILEVTRRRCPCRVIVSPAVVQGDAAPSSLVRALTRLWAWPGVDVIIIGRGGGSMEDLWAFNDERLARAIAACPVPIVSAVGHEVDVTVCDLVADLRAATPSHAAELVVPDRELAVARVDELALRLARAVRRRVMDERGRLDGGRSALAAQARRLVAEPRRRLETLARRLEAADPTRAVVVDRRRFEALSRRLWTAGQPLARPARARLQDLERRLGQAGRALPRAARVRLARAAGALDALSPLSVLQRGYAVVLDAEGRAVTDAGGLRVGDPLQVRLSRGHARVEVVETHAAGEDDEADPG
jgi:exodeoxyribonuclease VII large subunit